MQAPIAISRGNNNTTNGGGTIYRSGNSAGSLTTSTNGVLGSSFAGASSGSFREAIAASFGKDATDMMDYSIARFSSSTASTDSDMTALPSTSVPRNKLENAFCRNFKCCGQGLENLHDLLQHYEEAHVKFEDDEVPSMVADDDNQSAASSSATSSQPPSPKSSSKAATTDSTSSSSSSGDASALDANEHLSAFDTTIMRSPFKGKKRSFGQFASNSTNNAQVHLNLRRALIDGGLGRSNSRSSSVYSANSPFTTPSNSIPGTPTMDSDVDSAFFGNGSAAPAFSSLSLRGASGEEHDLPSCAPPNLFFPATGSNSSTTVGSSFGLPPTKQAKLNGLATVNSALENSLANPGALGDRPYKCTSPGCDKAYKQMNGLKYHRLHGQCNQNMLPPQQQLNSVVSDNAASNSAAAAAAATAAATAASNSAVAGTSLASSSSTPASGSSSSVVSNAKANTVLSSGTVTSPLPISTSRTASPTRLSTSSETGGDTSPTASSPDSTGANAQAKQDKIYICQVGACGKRYKNLNGLRYHYLHSGSHGLLGLQLLHANGGGASARADATTGRPAISTNDLSSDALAAAAQAAAAQQQAIQQGAALQQQQAQQGTAQGPSTQTTESASPVESK